MSSATNLRATRYGCSNTTQFLLRVRPERKNIILLPGDIPVVKSDRGGHVTYHGPGQITAYVLVDLKRLKLGVRDLVTLIEQALVDTLKHWQI